MVEPTGPAILVVDDEPEIRGLLLDCLEVHGYRVISAQSPADAIRILAAHAEIRLMLTDVVMPGGMNGFELGRAALVDHPELAVLYMSGYAPGDFAAPSSPTPPPILQKPFRFERVLDAIAAALGRVDISPPAAAS
jgi:CheY-like chemotaxis protein